MIREFYHEAHEVWENGEDKKSSFLPLRDLSALRGSISSEFDLAVMDRFACYIPGWEMPKNSSDYLTDKYGFITDYLAEAFHYAFNDRRVGGKKIRR